MHGIRSTLHDIARWTIYKMWKDVYGAFTNWTSDTEYKNVVNYNGFIYCSRSQCPSRSPFCTIVFFDLVLCRAERYPARFYEPTAKTKGRIHHLIQIIRKQNETAGNAPLCHGEIGRCVVSLCYNIGKCLFCVIEVLCHTHYFPSFATIFPRLVHTAS